MPKEKNNKLIIAAAGSGKTEYIVTESIKILKENPNARILITTYTIENELELKQRFLKIKKYIPKNIIIQTYFSFLMQHGVKPYKWHTLQSDYIIKGMVLVSGQSASKIDIKTGKQIIVKDNKTGINRPLYWREEENIYKHFFNSNHDIYSDKIAKFTIRCNEKSNGEVIKRLEEIYTHIFIDEVQDLAGYDLELVKLLLNSTIETTMVGDQRQTIYLTHHSKKHSKYQNGKIDDFIKNECNTKKKEVCFIDTKTLNTSHRNNQQICDFANKLYPSLEATKPCECCEKEVNHIGVFVIKESDKDAYLQQYNCIQLRWDRKCEKVNKEYEIYNFGQSKGQTFDRVIIYPTTKITQYLYHGRLTVEKGKSKGKTDDDEFDIAKFYVAVTRARHSVCILIDDSYFDNNFIEGVSKYSITPLRTPPQEP